MTHAFTVTEPVSGESFEFEVSDEMWIDMQAYCLAAGVTMDQLIEQALARYFEAAPAAEKP